MPPSFAQLCSIVAMLATAVAAPTPSGSVHVGARPEPMIPKVQGSTPVTRNGHRIAAKALDKRQQLTSNARQYMHAVEMTLGGNNVKLYLDTGSSDIWLVETNFQCIDENGKPINATDCQFVASGFDPSTATGSRIEPSFFGTGYTGGDHLTGYGWTSDAVLNGVTLRNQTFAVVNEAHFAGDGYTSGLIGLGSLYTNGIYRTDSSNPARGDDNRVVVPNPVTLAWKQGFSSEYHSLALNRVPFDANHNGIQPAGYLSFGGRPAEVAVTGKQVTIPCIKWSVGVNGTFLDEQALSGFDAPATFVFPGSDQIGQSEVTLQMDTGSSGVGLPNPVFDAYQALINSTACDGSGMPDLSVRISGVNLAFDKRDLLGYNPGQNTCFFNAYASGTQMAALGPNYAQNAVFVWNKATGDVTIMERAPY